MTKIQSPPLPFKASAGSPLQTPPMGTTGQSTLQRPGDGDAGFQDEKNQYSKGVLLPEPEVGEGGSAATPLDLGINDFMGQYLSDLTPPSNESLYKSPFIFIDQTLYKETPPLGPEHYLKSTDLQSLNTLHQEKPLLETAPLFPEDVAAIVAGFDAGPFADAPEEPDEGIDLDL